MSLFVLDTDIVSLLQHGHPRPTILSWAFMNQTAFSSSVFCLTSRRWLGPQGTTGVRPLERLGEHSKYSDSIELQVCGF